MSDDANLKPNPTETDDDREAHLLKEAVAVGVTVAALAGGATLEPVEHPLAAEPGEVGESAPALASCASGRRFSITCTSAESRGAD